MVDETADGVDNPTKIEYTPAANWNGTIEFDYTLQDSSDLWGTGILTDTAHVVIQVNKVNDDPVAADFLSESTNEDTPLLIDVLPSATDIDDDDTANLNTDLPLDPNDVDLSIDPAGFSGVDNGTATVEDNKVKFSPDTNWNGEETFTYTIIDASGGSSTADITIMVNKVNDDPVAADFLSESTDEDTPLLIDVLPSATDIDDDDTINLNTDLPLDPNDVDLSIDPAGFSGVDNGTATVEDNKVKFSPDTNWNGEETFTYTVIDASGGSSTAQITIMVNKVNDDPVAADFLSESTDEDTPLLIDVLPSATDIDDDDTINLNTDLPLDPNDVDLSIDPAGFSGVDNGTATVEDNKVKFSRMLTGTGKRPLPIRLSTPAAAAVPPISPSWSIRSTMTRWQQTS